MEPVEEAQADKKKNSLWVERIVKDQMSKDEII